MKEGSCKMSTPISSQNGKKYSIEKYRNMIISVKTYQNKEQVCRICHFLAACPSRLKEAAHGGLPPNAWKGVLPNSGPLLCGSCGWCHRAHEPVHVAVFASPHAAWCDSIVSMRLFGYQVLFFCAGRVLGDSNWFISKHLLCYQVLLTASNDIPRIGWHSAQKGAFLLEGVCQHKKI